MLGRRADHVERRANGLRDTALAVQDLLVRRYRDDTPVVIGTQVVEGTNRGNPAPAQTRATMGFVGSRLASIQMAFVAGTPAVPPIPGRPR